LLKTEREYRAAQKDFSEALANRERFRTSLVAEGWKDDEIEALMAPVVMRIGDLHQELHVYEDTRKGIVPVIPVNEVGKLLISLRIAHGLKQKDLAERLGVHWTEVSRDERNDYRGIKQDRVDRIAAALQEEVFYIRHSEYRELCRRARVVPYSLPTGNSDVSTIDLPVAGTIQKNQSVTQEVAGATPPPEPTHNSPRKTNESYRPPKIGNMAPTSKYAMNPLSPAA
jgi:transcriptional regulator with XRE-family HTH domain